MSPITESRLRRSYPAHEWEPLSDELASGGAAVFRLSGPSALYVKVAAVSAHPDPGRSPLAEAERLEWLATRGVPAPSVADAGVLDDAEYLVSTAASGRPASDDWPPSRRMDVMDALADFAKWLHSLPSDDCPFDRGLPVTLGNARCSVDVGLVASAGFEAEHQGWDAQRALTEVVAMAAELEPGPGVLCHGDFCLPNVLLDPETLAVTAIIDVGRFGRADRYTDIALMMRSVSHPHMNHQFNVEHARRFADRYGEVPLDTERATLYRLLDEFT